MKITNEQIYTAKEPLQRLSTEKLPVKTSWQLAKLAVKLNEPFKAIEEVRTGLIRQYGTPNENGVPSIKPDNPNWEKFISEFNELMSQEVELVFDKIILPETISATCDKCHHNMNRPMEIESGILLALEPFIKGISE